MAQHQIAQHRRAQNHPRRHQPASQPLEWLEQIDLFHGVAEEARRAVADRLLHKRIPARTILFRGGDPCKGVYFVLRGRFEVYRSAPNGKMQVLHVVGPGETLGEVPLLDGGPYPASTRAATDGEVLFLSCCHFQWLYENRPDIAEAVLRDLGRRLRELMGLVETLSLRDVPRRVAAMIAQSAVKHGVLQRGGVLELDRTQAEIATELGTTREGVARGLARLSSRGVIRYAGSRIEILDPGVLEAPELWRREERDSSGSYGSRTA